MNSIDIPYIYYDTFAKFIKSNGYQTDGIRKSPAQVVKTKGYIDLLQLYIEKTNVAPTFITTNMPLNQFLEFRKKFLLEKFGWDGE